MSDKRGRPFQKGQSGNPGGRRAMPKQLREDLKSEAEDSVRRLMEFAKDAAKRDDPKSLPYWFAANIRIQTLTWGKDPVVVEVEGRSVTLQPVDLSHYTDAELADMERIERSAEQRRLAAQADADGH